MYPSEISSKIITGQYQEIYFDRSDGLYKTRPKRGWIYVYPAVTEIRIDENNLIYDLSEIDPQRVPVDEDGWFEFEAIVTDQPGITPNNGWTYRIVPSWGEQIANVPILTTTETTININQFFGAEEVPGYIITKGDTGIGITNVTSAGNLATVHYTDGSTSTFELPIGDGTGGSTPDATTEVKGKILIAGDLTGTASNIVIGADKIGSSKLDPAVRTSLGKADSAVQPAGLTKTAVGLGNVDNTSDTNKPVSNATQTALNLKVNISSLHAVATSGSYTDLTNKPTIPATKADIGLGNVDNTSDLNKPVSTATQTALNGKANSVHTHSQYIQTVNGVSPDGSGAVTVSSAWDDITGKPTTFTPATHTHSYTALTDIPSTFTPTAHNHVWADITDKPTTFTPSTHTHAYGDLTGIPSTFAPSAHNHPLSEISDATTIGRSIASAADGPAVRTLIGAGTSSLALGSTGSTAAAGNHVHAYSSLTGIPSTFAPSAHNHVIADTTGLQTALDGKAASTHTHATSDVTGLDAALANKANVSALTSKADLVGGKIPTSQIPNESLIRAVFVDDTAEMLALTIADVQNGDIARIIGESSYYTLIDDTNIDDINSWFYTPAPTGGSETVLTVNGQVGDVVLGKADVGLGNVNNTSDLNKPISNDTQTALDLKSDIGHTHTTADISDGTTIGRNVFKAADGPAIRTLIGAGTGNSNLALGTTSTTAKAGDYQPAWTDVTSKPSTFPPDTHSHAIADTTGLQTALDAKAPIASPTFTGTVVTPALRVTTSASTGRILTSDGSGNATWIQNKPVFRDTAANWAPVTLVSAAIAQETDTGKVKIGDGTTVWTSLPYIKVGSTDIADSTTDGRAILTATNYAAMKTALDLNNVSNTSDANKPVSTATQTQLDLKAPLASPTFTGTPVAPTATGGTNTTQIATTAFVQSGLSGKANTSHTHLWADITDKPSTFAPSTHSHATSDVTGLDTALSGKEPTITAGTSAQYYRGDKTMQTLDKAAVGLGNVTNESKSTMFSSPAFTGTPTAPTATAGTNTTQLATTAYVDTGLGTKANSTHTHAQSDVTNLVSDLAAKAPLASPAFTGTPTGITKTHVGLGSVDNTSDATKNSASVTLTNKTISGSANTLSNIAQSSVTNLTTDLAAKVAKAGTATTLWAGTQAQYDAIGTKDSGTVYIVTA